MEYKDMKLDEVRAKYDEALKFTMEGHTAEEINANTEELRNLKERETAILLGAEERKAERKKVAEDPTLPIIKEFKKESEAKTMEYNATSKEYRSAFLKNLVGSEMSVEERAAFTHTTANTTAPLPTTMLNEIWNQVSKQHVIMGDIRTLRTGTIIEINKHTAIVQGKAKVTAEAVANDDEQNTIVKVTLSGKDFSKHVILSYAMAAMSIDALEGYLTTEIADNIGEALADDAIATIKTGVAVGNKVNSVGVKVLTYLEIAKLFGLLKNANNKVVYANNATFYNYIVSIVDTAGRPIFQPTMQDGAQGVLLGAQVKIEESVADNEIFVGDPQRVVCNMVQDILIEQDRDIKTHSNIYAGYARAESALLFDTAFAILTVKQA